MKHHIGDRFTIDGVECEIGYINANQAWLFSIEDKEYSGDIRELKGMAVAIINEKGRTKMGKRALPVYPDVSGAV